MDATKLGNPEAELKNALNAFENCVIGPIVSGDLAAWIGELQRTWAEADAQIHSHVKYLHPRQYGEISEQNPELLPRIELLKAEDIAIEEQRGRLNESVVSLAQQGHKSEPDEAKARKYTQSVIDVASSLVARMRKQSVAVQTWYIEAFDRDSGAVD